MLHGIKLKNPPNTLDKYIKTPSFSGALHSFSRASFLGDGGGGRGKFRGIGGSGKGCPPPQVNSSYLRVPSKIHVLERRSEKKGRL